MANKRENSWLQRLRKSETWGTLSDFSTVYSKLRALVTTVLTSGVGIAVIRWLRHQPLHTIFLWAGVGIALTLIIAIAVIILYESFRTRPNLHFYVCENRKIGYVNTTKFVLGLEGQQLSSIVLQFTNNSHPKRKTKDAGLVKASITFKYKRSDQSERVYTPATWVYAERNAVPFSVGDSRYLVLAVSFDYKRDWYVPINRNENETRQAPLH
jgi:hypothetical protein